MGGVDPKSGKRSSCETFDIQCDVGAFVPDMLHARASSAAVTLYCDPAVITLPVMKPEDRKVINEKTAEVEEMERNRRKVSEETALLLGSVCARNPGCHKPNRHTGRCKIQGPEPAKKKVKLEKQPKAPPA